MAYGLGIPVLGAGRLEADALPLAGLSASRLVPLHAAGRAELAWAAYVAAMPGLREVVAPGLAPAAALLNAIEPKDVVVADLATLPADLPGQLSERGARLVQAATNRAVAVSALGWQRVQAGVGDEQATLVPLYLRAPAIGPQNQPSR
jgi:tRNA A37 threonylcarbamoyladenosine modification protein TsaB